MKVKIVNGNHQYDDMFRGMGHSLVSLVEAADLVCFTGGADVTPMLYGDKQHKYTSSDYGRDMEEISIYKQAMELGIPMVGICRGGQFLNVMNGGRMYQHVTGHTTEHDITDLETGDSILVSSTHHQMMMKATEGILVAISHHSSDREWYNASALATDTSDVGVEVVYYDKTNSLCFQPHPEFPSVLYNPMRKYFVSLLSRYLDIT